MLSADGDRKPEKFYLTSAVESINPWAASRSTTPNQDSKRDELPAGLAPAAAPGDHSVTPLYGQSFRTYPRDCPPLKIQWFHAVDVPKRKPQLIKGLETSSKDAKPPSTPKKFTAFSQSDSKRIEARYQKLLEAAEDNHSLNSRSLRSRRATSVAYTAAGHESSPEMKAIHVSAAASENIRVPVNEDFLFDVDIEERELAPVYWLGPVYEVRRGTWFFQEGSNLRPCEENLAAQLEEGYLKTKPWLYQALSRSQPVSKEPESQGVKDDAKNKNFAVDMATKPSQDGSTTPSAPSQPVLQPQPYRLFGAYMSNVATYQDSSTAWLSTDGVLSWVTTSVYERFAGGGYMSGVKLLRGYTESKKSKDKEEKAQDPSTQSLSDSDQRPQRTLKRKTAPRSNRDPSNESEYSAQQATVSTGSRQIELQRRLSSFIENEGIISVETDEEIRKREEQEIRNNYNAQAGETQGREIEHLVLVTHGIGQRLGLRMESVNFVHDVNMLRKTLKSVYKNSADLKALNSELDAGPGNCRVQVLPVCWRHLIEFPRQRQRKGERDLGDVSGEEDKYPSLEDITVEGVAFARSLISDLALDVLLYQSSYREEICRVVVDETNRIVRRFRERNPDFKGKVHLMGHSLGSAIFFDLLCRQAEAVNEPRHPLRFWPTQGRPERKLSGLDEMQFDFHVHDYFCLGSPVGLFQMLQGRTIAGRRTVRGSRPEKKLDAGGMDDPFLSPQTTSTGHGSFVDGLPSLVSSPKIEQLFNIFHPSDPISYRLEPLISRAMAGLKPQALPYTKRSIFRNVTPQGLTGFGAKVGQSVSGLWSSLSAGIASNLLNRSLGFTNEEVTRIAAGDTARQKRQATGGDDETPGLEAKWRKQQVADSAATDQHCVTLIDEELETLYATFERSRTDAPKDEDAAKASKENRWARRLRSEETKVRALNRNGRVDYSIQESALDFNPINTIASHMGYWADEDVNHFILSQLLSSRTGSDVDKRRP